MSGAPIKVVLVDDHPVVREGLAALLRDEDDLDVVGQYARGEELLERVDRGDGLDADVAVLDLRLPGMSGVDTCEALLRRVPGIRVIVLTSFPSEAAVLAAFNAGARSFLMKESADPGMLCEAIRSVASGGTFIDPRVAGRVVAMLVKQTRTKGPYGLTMQEMRVVGLLPRGFTNQQIADHLTIAVATVKTHLYNAMRKMSVSNRQEAAEIARREGFV